MKKGIGASTAERFAEAGSSVYIIGRSQGRGEALVEKLRASSSKPGQTFEFISADLSLMSSVKRVADELQRKTAPDGVHYLVETQGKTPNGIPEFTQEGHESHFALQCLSRFGLAHLLAKSGTLKESVVFVCAPNGKWGAAPDVDNLDLAKIKDAGRLKFFWAQFQRDSNVMDGVAAEFANVYPHLKTFHAFPGVVTSSLAENARLPYPVVLLTKLGAPIIQRTFGNSPTSYSHIPVYLAANPKAANLGLAFVNERLKPIPPKWPYEQPEIRKKLWDKMIELGDF